MKSYTDIEQSKKLAEILPLESADMVLPFTHEENNEYVPGYAVSRNYMEAYNEMLLLPAMDKDTISKLIQPAWSFAVLLNKLPSSTLDSSNDHHYRLHCMERFTEWHDNAIDACCEMIIKLHERKML